jgi:hypothetical protein
MSLTEQVVRAESGAYRIPYFFSASMCKDLHPNSQDSGRTRQKFAKNHRDHNHSTQVCVTRRFRSDF